MLNFIEMPLRDWNILGPIEQIIPQHDKQIESLGNAKLIKLFNDRCWDA